MEELGKRQSDAAEMRDPKKARTDDVAGTSAVDETGGLPSAAAKASVNSTTPSVTAVNPATPGALESSKVEDTTGGASAAEPGIARQATQEGTTANVVASVAYEGKPVEVRSDAGVPAQKGEPPKEQAPGGQQRKYKKRKVAMYLAYNGAGYQGMQRNPGARTIEGELELALHKAGAIAELNFGDPRKVDWMRAARTDKGVSAAGQVVSGRMVIDPPGFVERVNENLPPQIRMLGYKRVTNTFNAKSFCDRRQYEYVLPVFAFDPNAHRERAYYVGARNGRSLRNQQDNEEPPVVSEVCVPRDGSDCSIKPSQNGMEAEIQKENVTPEAPAGLSTESVAGIEGGEGFRAAIPGSSDAHRGTAPERLEAGDLAGSAALPDSSPTAAGRHEALPGCGREDGNGHSVVNEGGESKGAAAAGPATPSESTPFEFTEEVRARLNRLLAKFQGTHNYHNFTQRVKGADPCANRYILQFDASEAFELEGVPHVCCRVLGQSFILHQIRKMVGLTIAVMRGVAPESIFDLAFRADRDVNVPLAPELGLFLEECLYPAYNKRFASSHENVSIDFVRPLMEQFKQEQIYPHIARTEKRECTVATWLHTLNNRNFPDFATAWAEETGRAKAASLASEQKS